MWVTGKYEQAMMHDVSPTGTARMATNSVAQRW